MTCVLACSFCIWLSTEQTESLIGPACAVCGSDLWASLCADCAGGALCHWLSKSNCNALVFDGFGWKAAAIFFAMDVFTEKKTHESTNILSFTVSLGRRRLMSALCDQLSVGPFWRHFITVVVWEQVNCHHLLGAFLRVLKHEQNEPRD